MAADTDALEQTYAAPSLPRRRRRPRAQGLLWLAVLAGLIAMGGFLVVTHGAAGAPVAVAGREIAAGEPVGPGDFRFIDAVVPAELSAQVLSVADVNAAGPRVTTHALTAGQLVQRGDLADASAPAAQRAMSIPVDPTKAVNGALHVGDLVDVIDGSGADPVYVLAGARVLAVADPGGGRLGGTSSHYAITVAVDPATALRVAGAIVADKLAVVRSTGAPPVSVSPPTTAVKR